MFSVISATPISVATIPDVVVTSPSDGQALAWNSTLSRWTNQSISGGGGVSTLSALTDVNLIATADRNYLRYDQATSRWINTPDPMSIFHTGSPAQGHILRYDSIANKYVTGNHLGNAVFTGDSIGLAGDTDLLTMATNNLTINGNLNLTGNVTNTLNLANGVVASVVSPLDFNLPAGNTEARFNFQSATSGLNLRNGATSYLTSTPTTTTIGSTSTAINGGLTVVNALANNTTVRLGSTSSANSFQVQNSALTTLFQVRGDGSIVGLPLSKISDATITAPTTGQVLTWNNTTSRWVNQSLPGTANIVFTGSNIGLATDTDLMALADNSLVVNGALNVTGSLQNMPLSKITDVTISSIANNQVLQYNSTTSRWENKTLATSNTGNIVFTGSDIGTAGDLDTMTVDINSVRIRDSLYIENPSLTVGGVLSAIHSAGEATISNTRGNLNIYNDVTNMAINLRAPNITLNDETGNIVMVMKNSHINYPQGYYASWGAGGVGPLQIVREASLSQISSNANRLLILNSASGQNTDVKGSNIRLLDLSDNVKLQTSAGGINLPQDQYLTFGSDLLQIVRQASKSQILNILNDLEIQNTATNGHIIAKLGTTSNATAFKVKDSAGTDRFSFYSDGSQTGLSLSNLNGVSLSSPSNGQVLSFNGSNWVNSTPASGGSTGSWLFSGAQAGIASKPKLIELTFGVINFYRSLYIYNDSNAMKANLQGYDDYAALQLLSTSTNYIYAGEGGLDTTTKHQCRWNTTALSGSSSAYKWDVSNTQVMLIRADGTMAGNFASASDQRDKKDITPLPLGLDFINQLQPKRYKMDERVKYLDDKENYPQFETIDQVVTDGSKQENICSFGFLAQDILSILPQACNTKLVQSQQDGSRYLMNYEQLIAPLVKAVQELSTALNLANTKIADLEAWKASISQPPN